MRDYLQLRNSPCKWELIYIVFIFGVVVTSLNIGLCELYKPQCNSKNGGRQLKVYQCKTYKNMDYYHLQVRVKATKGMTVDKKVSLL